jgi:F0F1-type ATP synthase alpha subunit
MQNLVHFGSELNESVKIILETGGKILELFDQDSENIVPSNVQAIVLSLLWGEDFKKMDVSALAGYKDKISSLYQTDESYRKLVDETVLKSTSFNDILRRVRQDSGRFQVEFPSNLYQGNQNTAQTQPANGQTKAPGAEQEIKNEKN